MENEIPERLRDLLEEYDWLKFENDMPPEHREIYERGKSGNCMTCENPVGEYTVVSVGPPGIIGLYCSGTCMVDMFNWGYLEQRLVDIKDQIAMRRQGAQGEGHGQEEPNSTEEDPSPTGS